MNPRFEETLNRALEEVFVKGNDLVLSFPTREARDKFRLGLYHERRAAKARSRRQLNTFDPGWDCTPWDGLVIEKQGETELRITMPPEPEITIKSRDPLASDT